MFERIRQMLIKEFIQVFRDPRMRTVIFVIPAVQTLVIGYAVTTDVRHVATAVCDMDNSTLSRELVAKFVDSGCFDVVVRDSDDRRVRELIDRGEAEVVLQMNHGFAEDLRGGRTARLQIILDGTDSNTAGIALGYASRITAGFSHQILLERYDRRLGALRQPGRVDLRTRAWFNPNLESRYFNVPGVIVIVVSVVTMLLTSMAIVREKEIGTIEQIIVSPITPAEFILGKTVPFATIALVDVCLITLIGVFWFEVPIRGSFLLLFFGTCLYLLNMLGMGLLISTVSSTQQQAMMGTFFFFFPAMLLSGFTFPVANMPLVVQWMTYLDAIRYFLVVVRGIFLKGIGLEILWPEMLILGTMGVVTLWLAVRRFHKTLA